jgi:hypothetical protein
MGGLRFMRVHGQVMWRLPSCSLTRVPISTSKELREDVTDNGELAFTMVWQSLETPYKMWVDEKRRKRYETFFGPGVGAEVVKIDAEQRLVGIRLTTGGPLSDEYLASKQEETEEVAATA